MSSNGKKQRKQCPLIKITHDCLQLLGGDVLDSQQVQIAWIGFCCKISQQYRAFQVKLMSQQYNLQFAVPLCKLHQNDYCLPASQLSYVHVVKQWARPWQLGSGLSVFKSWPRRWTWAPVAESCFFADAGLLGCNMDIGCNLPPHPSSFLWTAAICRTQGRHYH